MELDPKSLQGNGNKLQPDFITNNVPQNSEHNFSGIPFNATPEDLLKTFPDIHTEKFELNKNEKQEIKTSVESSINKESIAEERILRELEQISKAKKVPSSPRDILKDLIMKGELRKTYDIFGHKWTLRALDQGDVLLAVDDIKDTTETAAGRMVAIAFSKVVYSIEEIDGTPIYQFFPEIAPDQFKTKIEYIIACKKALRAYLLGMPQIVIDEVYDRYTQLEAERDKAIVELKN